MAKLSELSGAVKLDVVSGAKLTWDKQDKWQQDSMGYSCTLRYKGLRLTVDFWQGVGISAEPTAEGVLDCLLSDATFGGMTFEDACAELGQDSDSRKGYAIWLRCKVIDRKLRRFLGDDFDSFNEAERD